MGWKKCRRYVIKIPLWLHLLQSGFVCKQHCVSMILIGYVVTLDYHFNCLLLKIDIYLSVFFAVDTKSQWNVALQLSSEKGIVTVAQGSL